ncbi:hypothetical protein V1511DRAFT_508759 [Dipodascopsis uninucleata]
MNRNRLFYTEDTVYTNDANNLGIVEKTWHDTVRDYTTDKYDEEHLDGPAEIVDHYFKYGIPPKGWTIVAETLGRRVIPDTALRLVDRSFSCGDICKRSALDRQSGTVIEVSMTVSLQHTLTNQVVHDVPGSEIELYLFPEEGQFVTDGAGRVGQIMASSIKAAVQLRNGALVWVDDAADLDIFVPELSKVAPPGGIAPSLIAQSTKTVFPHQSVTTDSENLRRGQWLYGTYDSSLSASGKVIKSEVEGISLRWMPDGPEEWIDISDEFSTYKVFRDSMDNANWTVGDRVVFKDSPEAFDRFQMNRVGRERYGGFDVNALIITSTTTRVKVLWQDLSVSTESAVSLVPYVLVDEHDIWPGEYVGRKDSASKKSTDEQDIDLDFTQIGVAQEVDARERTAKVRWFKNTEQLTPENITSEEDIEDVSFYELVPHPLISYGVGDFVYLPHAPCFTSNSLQTNGTDGSGGLMSSLARAIISQGNYQLTQLARSFLPIRSSHSHTSLNEEQQMVHECDWYGQITSLNLDGSATVMLGFTDQAKQVVCPASVLIGAPNEDDDEDDDYDDYDLAQSTDLSEIIDMTDEPSDSENQRALGDGDMMRQLMIPRMRSSGTGQVNGNDNESGSEWEDDSEYSDSEELSGNGSDKESENTSHQGISVDSSISRRPHADEKENILDNSNMTSEFSTLLKSKTPSLPNTLVRQESEVTVMSEGSDSPPRFLILDSDPDDSHHYGNSEPSKLNHRRLAKERKILANSLPEGIYVRTYTNRLDLFRALIIGPADTPYEMAPFLFDIHITSHFPTDPPECYFHSWNTNGIGRVNPNLYEDGKICLSLLGTWPGEQSSETWNPETSSILQLLVSLQGLVLNNTPYYNEAGYDTVQGAETAEVNASLYSERTFVLSRGFILYALQHEIAEFSNVIKYLYYDLGLLDRVVDWEQEVLENSMDDSNSEMRKNSINSNGLESAIEASDGTIKSSATSDLEGHGFRIARVTKGAKVLLQKNYTSLRRILELHSNQ